MENIRKQKIRGNTELKEKEFNYLLFVIIYLLNEIVRTLNLDSLSNAVDLRPSGSPLHGPAFVPSRAIIKTT